jgi:predicted LPLAT superfamily acyltransferase
MLAGQGVLNRKFILRNTILRFIPIKYSFSGKLDPERVTFEGSQDFTAQVNHTDVISPLFSIRGLAGNVAICRSLCQHRIGVSY